MKVFYKNKNGIYEQIYLALCEAILDDEIIDRILLTDKEYSALYHMFSIDEKYIEQAKELVQYSSITFGSHIIKLEVI